MEEKNPVSELLQTALTNLKELINADIVIGKEIKSGGTTIIPVSKVTFGYGTGGAVPPEKSKFGGASGGGVTVNPVGFLVITDGNVRLLQISSADNTADRIVNMVPDVVDKVQGIISTAKEKKANEHSKENI